MAIPNLHAPDEEWAEERVKRMMEPDKPIEPLVPGDEVVATNKDDQAEDTPNTVEATTDSESDVDIDALSATPPVDGDKTNTAQLVADPKTDKAVDDVLKSDGEAVLDAQDAATEHNVVMKPNMWERIKNDIADWWDNPRERYITLGVIALLLAAVFSFPASRMFAMNLVGFRGDVTVGVLDGSTHLPLKNATVTLGGKTGATNSSGKLTLKRVHLGSEKLVITKSAFAPYSQAITVTSGAHTLNGIGLKAVGRQYTFTITDYVSGKAVTAAESSSGQASAQTDKTGKSTLTVSPSDTASISVQISAKGYRTEKITIDGSTKTSTSVKLVPSGKDIFVSKQSGKYDLCTVDFDGKNRKVLLAATGNENQNLSLKVSPDGSQVAFVSTRDNQRDGDGYLLSTLSLVNVSTGAVTTLEHAEAINLLGWSDTKLVYEQIVAGASAANPSRQRINSYDYQTAKKLQLTSANYFDGELLVGSVVYYAVSSTDPNATANANKISVDGTNKQPIASQEVYTMLRTNYDTISLQTSSSWLSYVVGSATAKPTTVPADYTSRAYLNNDSDTKSLWIDNRDGKGALLSYDIASKKDTVITSQGGLVSPVRWINATTVTYQISTSKETADYIVSLAGGQPQKVADVTSTQ